MESRKVRIQYEAADHGWRIYWSDTNELADGRLFPTIVEAGPIARALMTLRVVSSPPE